MNTQQLRQHDAHYEGVDGDWLDARLDEVITNVLSEHGGPQVMGFDIAEITRHLWRLGVALVPIERNISVRPIEEQLNKTVDADHKLMFLCGLPYFHQYRTDSLHCGLDWLDREEERIYGLADMGELRWRIGETRQHIEGIITRRNNKAAQA